MSFVITSANRTCESQKVSPLSYSLSINTYRYTSLVSVEGGKLRAVIA